MAGDFTPTRAWDETTPVGTDAGATLDNKIREILVDIRERLAASHHFQTAGSNTWEFVGAHRVGFVSGVKQHTTSANMKTWCDDNYGATTADWIKYATTLHWVNADGTANKNGLYRMNSSGTLHKICDKTSDSITVTT